MLKKNQYKKKFFYTYETIAEIVDVSPASLRQRVFRGKLDMNNLRSVINYVNEIKQGVLHD